MGTVITRADVGLPEPSGGDRVHLRSRAPLACEGQERAGVGGGAEPAGLASIVPIEGHVVERLVRRVEQIVQPVQLAARVGQATTSVHQGMEAVRVARRQLDQQSDDRVPRVLAPRLDDVAPDLGRQALRREEEVLGTLVVRRLRRLQHAGIVDAEEARQCVHHERAVAPRDDARRRGGVTAGEGLHPLGEPIGVELVVRSRSGACHRSRSRTAVSCLGLSASTRSTHVLEARVADQPVQDLRREVRRHPRQIRPFQKSLQPLPVRRAIAVFRAFGHERAMIRTPPKKKQSCFFGARCEILLVGQDLSPAAPPRSSRRRSSSSSSSPRTRAWPRRRRPPSPRSACAG